MRLILDENLPQRVRDGFDIIPDPVDIKDIDEEHKGLLDLEIVDLMESDDILVTADREFHRNILKTGGKSIYYDIQIDNLVEIQVKTLAYLKGHDPEIVETVSPENNDVVSGPNALLRKRFQELKEENSALKVRINVLEGKLRSVYLTADSALEDKGYI